MFDSMSKFFSDLYDAFISGRLSYPSLKEVVGRVIEVFYAPQADPVATIMSSLFLINIFSIILVIVLWLVLRRNDNRVLKQQRQDFNKLLIEKDPEHAPEILKTDRIESRWFISMVTIATFFLLLFTINFATGTNKMCASCHKTTIHEKAFSSAGPHKGVECISCHEPSGFMARSLTSLFPRASHILVGADMAQKENATQQSGLGSSEVIDAEALTGKMGSTYGGVSSQSCLQCHKSIRKNVSTNITSGIRVEHTQFMKSGTKCLDCHTKSASGQIEYSKGMDVCIVCHDGVKASSECSTCHTKNFAAASAARVKPVNGIEHDITMDCYRCHNSARCDSCHGGVRMPHSKKFMTTGLHAYDAASAVWNKTSKCTKCHKNNADCKKCHGDFPFHYSSENKFNKTHTSGMWENKDCGLCHTYFNPDFKKSVKPGDNYICVSCHSAAGASAR